MPYHKKLTEILSREQLQLCAILKDSHLIYQFVTHPDLPEIQLRAGQPLDARELAMAIEYCVMKADLEVQHGFERKIATMQ